MGSFWSFILLYPEIFLVLICFFWLSLFSLVRWCQKSTFPVNWPVAGMLPFLVQNLYYIHDKVADVLREAGCTFMLSSKVELESIFMRFFLDVSYSTVFAADLDCLSMSSPIPVFGQATKEAEEAVLFRHVVPPSVWKLLKLLNIGCEKKVSNAKVVIDQFIYEEITKRKAQACNDDAQGDVLSLGRATSSWPSTPDPGAALGRASA
ncbi:hypothetical protein ABZP36_014743 [Zizania latifolia]